MKIKMALLILALLGWGCKQNADTQKSKVEDAEQKTEIITMVSPVIKELVDFADLTLTDSTDVHELILFKGIDTSGVVTEIDSDKALALYEKMKKRGLATSYPIFEVKNTEKAILPIKGVGFGGAIWAKVLVDRTTLEIKKIAFDHKAESEGYGADITKTPFENQFEGMIVNFDHNTFTLQGNMEKRIDDGTVINGISGATMTNQGVIEMINQGMKLYKGYLKP